MIDGLALPEFADHLRGFDEAFGAFIPATPIAGGGFFVQSFAGAEAKINSSRIKKRQRSERLGDDAGIIAIAGAGNGSAHFQRGGVRAERAQERKSVV